MFDSYVSMSCYKITMTFITLYDKKLWSIFLIHELQWTNIWSGGKWEWCSRDDTVYDKSFFMIQCHTTCKAQMQINFISQLLLSFARSTVASIQKKSIRFLSASSIISIFNSKFHRNYKNVYIFLFIILRGKKSCFLFLLYMSINLNRIFIKILLNIF